MSEVKEMIPDGIELSLLGCLTYQTDGRTDKIYKIYKKNSSFKLYFFIFIFMIYVGRNLCAVVKKRRIAYALLCARKLDRWRGNYRSSVTHSSPWRVNFVVCYATCLHPYDIYIYVHTYMYIYVTIFIIREILMLIIEGTERS